MYKQMINLAPGETLQLDWDKNYANFSIYLNGQPVGSFPDKSSLKLGHRFNLPGDGQRQITVILAEQGLQVWYNGIDIVSGMKSGDSDHFDNAAKYLIGYGILQLVGGLIVAALNQSRDAGIITAILVVIIGSVLIGLGIWAKKSGATWPLTTALVLLVLNLVLAMAVGRIPGLFITSLMIYYLYKGIRAGALQKSQVLDFGENSPLDAGV